MSVVNGTLQIRGLRQPCIAEAWILPRITTGNLTAPCVAIGERAGDLLKDTHRLGSDAAAATRR